jgi:hypothetical protein
MRSITGNAFPFRLFSSALGFALAVTATVAWCNTAQATVFTFSDEYLLKAGTAFSTVFPGASGNATGNANTFALYQETNTTTPTITKLGNGSSVPGEFVQNSPTNASEGIQLFGWSQSLNGGQQVGSVYNLNNPINGANTYFQYKTGVTGGLFGNGTTTAFTFNSFDLRGSTSGADFSFTLEGLDALNNVLDSAAIHVTGNTFQTFTENWAGVTTVEVVSTAGLPLNWGSGYLYMDNLRVNEAVTSPVPEPSTWVTMLLGFAGVGFMAYRRKSKPALMAA